jgi:hypothetical protein
MKMYGGVEIKLHAFITLALDEDEWSGMLWPFYLWGKSPWYVLNGRLNRPQSQCGHGSTETNHYCCQGLKPGHPAHSQSSYWLSYKWYYIGHENLLYHVCNIKNKWLCDFSDPNFWNKKRHYSSAWSVQYTIHCLLHFTLIHSRDRKFHQRKDHLLRCEHTCVPSHVWWCEQEWSHYLHWHCSCDQVGTFLPHVQLPVYYTVCSGVHRCPPSSYMKHTTYQMMGTYEVHTVLVRFRDVDYREKLQSVVNMFYPLQVVQTVPNFC